MNRICLHGDIAQMTVALYRAEDKVACSNGRLPGGGE
jgi:hypothetical protein